MTTDGENKTAEEVTSPSKPSPNKQITVNDFADLYGLNQVNRVALNRKYKGDKKTKGDWVKEIGKKVDLKRKKTS